MNFFAEEYHRFFIGLKIWKTYVKYFSVVFQRLWLLNNSLLDNEVYVDELKERLQNLKQSLNEQGIDNPRMKWELLKYEVRKFSITYSKKLARERKLNYAEIENQIKDIENT